MSFLAQEESRSISENVTWGQRKRFADGKVSFAYSRFLGYSRGEDGIPQIIEEEAEIVRRIYRLFISGKTACSIARLLTKEGIPTPSGKQNWSVSTVESILRNEKYKGSALLQKKFTVDFLAKKMKVNEGEVPQYFVEHSHEPIIDPEEFERVQVEFTRRKAMGRSYSSSGVFASKIVCGDCGGFYGSKVWHSTDKYRRTIWQCNAKFKGEHKCTTPHLDEEDIKSRFVKAINTIEKDKEALLESCEQIKTLYTDCTEIDDTMRALRQEIEVVTGITRAYIEENTRAAQNQDEFRKRYNELEKRYEKAVDRYNALEQKRAQRMARVGTFDTFIKAFKELDGTVFSFDKRLWQTLLDHVTVRADGVLVFCFNNGTEIEA